MARFSRPLIWGAALIGAAAVAAAMVLMLGKGETPIATSQPATLPQTLASVTTAPATEPTVMRTYGQVLHADLPNYPQTQPWATNVDLAEAAHVVLHEPVYVCPRGDLWITRADADPLSTVLARATTEPEHIIDQVVRYVLWMPNAKGEWQAAAVCGDDDNLALVSATTRQAIPGHRSYRWDLAMDWQDNGTSRLIVPTDRGISVLTAGATLTEDYVDLADSPASTEPGVAATAPSTIASTAATSPSNALPRPQVLFDLRGLLAWIPADGDFRGPSQVARFVDGKWVTLDALNWPASILHLVPMLDGSVLQVRRGIDADSVELTIVPLDNPAINEKDVLAIVNELGNDDPDKRVSAFQLLTQYGPGIYPILEKAQSHVPPEAQARLHSLLDGRMATQLGGMMINDNLLTVTARLRDGGAVFFAPHGVSIPQEQQDPKIVSPDYLVVRPGQAVRELPGAIIAALDGQKTIDALRDEWILNTPDKGPQRYLPPEQFYPLVHGRELGFSHLVAIDSRGRWVLRGEGNSSTRPTLIIDPTVPDPTPKLAIWMIDTGKDAGWNKSDWPTLLRGATHWLVNSRDWEAMDENSDAMSIELPAATLPSTSSTTVASSLPTTLPQTEPEGKQLLLIDAAGNRYYDGETTLTIVDAKGRQRIWTLPENCAGDAEQRAWLVPDRDGHLFLFNAVGRIVRLRPTLDEAQPFVVESVFTHSIPPFREIRRIWLDPAGRIAVIYEEWRMAIIFPTGQISPEIADRVLMQDVKRTDEGQ
ncbi:MAG: hypothetical protein M3O30_19415 [Planctomycetota bacterium]|nr:hypothetical protein [Planctomycetota bacterium]